MNQQTTNNPTEPKRHCRGGLGRQARLGVATVALIGFGAVAGALIANVSAHSGFGGHGHWSAFKGHRYHGVRTIEQSRERALDVAAWVLGSVDATPEQSQRIKAIVVNLVDELYPLGEQHHEDHRRLMDALSQPQVDRQALEQIREAQLVLTSKVSARLVSALADTADVLSPEQRQQLMNRFERFAH